MTPFRLAVTALVLSGITHPAMAAFELSEDYVPSTELHSGHYICRTMYDLFSASHEIDLVADGPSRAKYGVRSMRAKGMVTAAQDGSLVFESGYFAPDEIATFEGMSATRIEDGKPVLILRQVLDGTEITHYCPWID